MKCRQPELVTRVGGYIAGRNRQRHQYIADVLGNAPGLNYAADYRSVSGVMVPTKRRVFAYDGKKQKIPEPVLVAIDIREIDFS